MKVAQVSQYRLPRGSHGRAGKREGSALVGRPAYPLRAVIDLTLAHQTSFRASVTIGIARLSVIFGYRVVGVLYSYRFQLLLVG